MALRVCTRAHSYIYIYIYIYSFMIYDFYKQGGWLSRYRYKVDTESTVLSDSQFLTLDL